MIREKARYHEHLVTPVTPVPHSPLGYTTDPPADLSDNGCDHARLRPEDKLQSVTVGA